MVLGIVQYVYTLALRDTPILSKDWCGAGKMAHNGLDIGIKTVEKEESRIIFLSLMKLDE